MMPSLDSLLSDRKRPSGKKPPIITAYRKNEAYIKEKRAKLNPQAG